MLTRVGKRPSRDRDQYPAGRQYGIDQRIRTFRCVSHLQIRGGTARTALCSGTATRTNGTARVRRPGRRLFEAIGPVLGQQASP